MDEPWINYVDSNTLANLVKRAAAAPRGRLNLNLHPRLDDPIQRLLNAGGPGTYVRPHRHRSPIWELVMTLTGHIDALVFDDDGRIIDRLPLKPNGDGMIQNEGAVWHSFVFLAPASVAFEVKPGPYDAKLDKEFAPWSPREEDADAAAFVKWMETAAVGERWVP